jgi:hypothetical protein
VRGDASEQLYAAVSNWGTRGKSSVSRLKYLSRKRKVSETSHQ